VNGRRNDKAAGRVVPRDKLDLEDPEGVISPPYLEEPIYQCSRVVVVRGFIPHAELEVYVGGAPVVTVADAGLGVPSGAVVELPAELRAGESVRALQRFGGAESDLSPEVIVRDHTQDYPTGLPQPVIDPTPLYECGVAMAVNNLVPGSRVRATADGGEVARLDAGARWVATYVSPAFSLGQEVVAFASLCNDDSPPSAPTTTQPRPASLPAPTIDPVTAGSELIVVRGLVNGARFHIRRNGADEGEWATAGPATSARLGAPVADGDVLTVTQRLCPGDPASPEGSTTVRPCSSLEAPVVAQVQAGDRQVELLEFVPGGRVKVFLNGTKVGDGSGPVVLLTTTVQLHDTVHVLQSLGPCVSGWVREIVAVCVAPPLGEDPAALHLFPVGSQAYDGGTFEVDGIELPIRGTVFYPAERDGPDEPFNARLADAGPVPIVFMAHGNHATLRDPDDPSQESCPPAAGFVEIANHEGYDYFQRQLAGMGIVAVGVYSNPTNCTGLSATNIHRRAALIVASMRHFRDLNAGGGEPFGGHVDLDRIGLMGHSRGGEAVIVAREVNDVPDARIRAVISLAPTDARASRQPPSDYALLVILPAADGDVVTNSGAHFYDRAAPAPFKVQLYVDGANHNYFNRRWPADDGVGPNRLARWQQERILSAYGCALYRAVLLGHDTAKFLTGYAIPRNVPAAAIHVSAVLEGQRTVDDHEQANGIGTNSMNQPTAQLAGLTAAEHDFRQGGSPFNGTFFGDTMGMVAESREATGEFRSQLDGSHGLTGREVWVRAGEVRTGSAGGATGFELGVEDGNGQVAWVDSDDVGGVPRPYPRGDGFEKTMPSTLRFKGACFRHQRELVLDDVVAIRLRLNRPNPRPVAFDDLQIVDPP
jgi:dienelactone hydrolase